jgi:tetratricopeptide (TPR) repeat protein
MGSRGSARRVLLAALLVAAATAAAYSPVVRAGFVYDDRYYIETNPRVATGLTAANARWALTALEQSNWHPLTWLSHQLDVELFGLRPLGHHLVSVVLHVADAELLLLLLWRLGGNALAAALVALLFALHPIHVESVAWVSERKDVLSTLLVLLAAAAYLGYVRRRSAGSYLAATAAFALALASKPMAVTFPCAMLLLDWWPLGRILTAARARGGPALPGREPLLRVCLEKLPWLALAAGSAAVTIVAQGDALNARIALSTRLLNAAAAPWRYVAKTLWPAGLAITYPFPPADALRHGALIGGALTLLATAAALHQARRRPWLLAGWCWYLGTLTPVLGLVQVGEQSMADRYLYIPSIGLFLVLAVLASGLARRARLPAPLALAGGVVLLCALAAATARQAGYWRDRVSLYGRAVAVTRDNWMAEAMLAEALVREGRLEEGVRHFRAALAIVPAFSEVRSDLAAALVRMGRTAEAVEELQRTLALAPGYAPARHALDVLLAQQRGGAAAVAALGAAARAQPDSASASESLGLALAAAGRHEEAIDAFTAALRLRPADPAALYGLGVSELALGRVGPAEEALRRAVALKPDYTRAASRLGVLLARTGRAPEAVGFYRQALRFQPGYPEAVTGLEEALRAGGGPRP